MTDFSLSDEQKVRQRLAHTWTRVDLSSLGVTACGRLFTGSLSKNASLRRGTRMKINQPAHGGLAAFCTPKADEIIRAWVDCRAQSGE